MKKTPGVWWKSHKACVSEIPQWIWTCLVSGLEFFGYWYVMCLLSELHLNSLVSMPVFSNQQVFEKEVEWVSTSWALCWERENLFLKIRFYKIWESQRERIRMWSLLGAGQNKRNTKGICFLSIALCQLRGKKSLGCLTQNSWMWNHWCHPLLDPTDRFTACCRAAAAAAWWKWQVHSATKEDFCLELHLHAHVWLRAARGHRGTAQCL